MADSFGRLPWLPCLPRSKATRNFDPPFLLLHCTRETCLHCNVPPFSMHSRPAERARDLRVSFPTHCDGRREQKSLRGGNMTPHDQELLDKQLHTIDTTPPNGVLMLAVTTVFF